MTARLLADTHIILRWMGDQKKLSRDQLRALEDSIRLRIPVAISAVTLLELAALFGRESTRLKSNLDGILHEIDSNPAFLVLPITVEIAGEVAAIGKTIPDLADRAIVATAIVHRLKLVTSDQRIIESGLVRVID